MELLQVMMGIIAFIALCVGLLQLRLARQDDVVYSVEEDGLITWLDEEKRIK